MDQAEIRLTNTLSRQKEVFTPITPDHVGIYSCGPTVYLRPHLGNYRAFIFADVLRRMFEFNGYEVNHVMNITDVGEPADDGEDKIVKQALAQGKTAWDIAEYYIGLFMADMKALNIMEPTHMPRATKHIPEQIALIQDLEKNGFIYVISDGVYFDTSKLADYGALSGQKLEDKQEGARVAVNAEKRNSTDFVLWKFLRPGEKRDMEWESPWGKGYPGWHIECSAMSEAYLVDPAHDGAFDIHTGGIDHIPVHHTNEMAQTEAAHGHKLANYWMHLDFLRVDNQKMSKSIGNVYSLTDIEGHGFAPLDLRYFFLGAQYRSSQNFTWEALEAAKTARRKLIDLLRSLPDGGEADKEALVDFAAVIDDDLNTPRGLALVWDILGSKLDPAAKNATILAMDEVFGLDLATEVAVVIVIPREVQELVDLRAAAREGKNFAESDRLRDEIAKLGFTVKDTAEGQAVEKI